MVLCTPPIRTLFLWGGNVTTLELSCCGDCAVCCVSGSCRRSQPSWSAGIWNTLGCLVFEACRRGLWLSFHQIDVDHAAWHFVWYWLPWWSNEMIMVVNKYWKICWTLRLSFLVVCNHLSQCVTLYLPLEWTFIYLNTLYLHTRSLSSERKPPCFLQNSQTGFAKHLLSFLWQLKATWGSLSCLEGEGEVMGIQLQHATSPLDVTKFYTLNL